MGAFTVACTTAAAAHPLWRNGAAETAEWPGAFHDMIVIQGGYLDLLCVLGTKRQTGGSSDLFRGPGVWQMGGEGGSRTDGHGRSA